MTIIIIVLRGVFVHEAFFKRPISSNDHDPLWSKTIAVQRAFVNSLSSSNNDPLWRKNNNCPGTCGPPLIFSQRWPTLRQSSRDRLDTIAPGLFAQTVTNKRVGSIMTQWLKGTPIKEVSIYHRFYWEKWWFFWFFKSTRSCFSFDLQCGLL